MNSPEIPRSLSRTLAEWRIMAARNPQFRAAVRNRIGRGGVNPPWQDFARQHGAVLAGALALAVVTGAVLGRERARARTAAESAQLATAYVQALDARLMRMQ